MGQRAAFAEVTELGSRMRQACDYAGKDQYVVANEMGAHPTTLTAIIRGRIKSPNWELMIRFAQATGVSLDWLAGRVHERALRFEDLI